MPLKTNEVCFGGPFHPPATSASYDIETRHVSKLWGGRVPTIPNQLFPLAMELQTCIVEMTALSTRRIYPWGTYVYYFYIYVVMSIYTYCPHKIMNTVFRDK